MPRRGWISASRGIIAIWCLLPARCQVDPGPAQGLSAPRRAADIARARLAADTPTASAPAEVPSELVKPVETSPPAPDEIASQVPDPQAALERLEKDMARPDLEPRERQVLQQLRERLNSLARPRVVRLSLADAIRRTLENNYAIQFQGYGPAIDAARIVEAEAAFDAVFFANFQNDKQDRPSASQLEGTKRENRIFQAGVRKLLASGMQVQTSYGLTRSSSDLIFQTLNPAYFNQFVVEFRQPFLKGFGLDYNRAQIELRRLDRRMSIEKLRREIQDQIYNVEQAYWRLFQARRNVVVSARLLTELELILRSLEHREAVGLDVYRVQVKQTESLIQQRRAEFVRIVNDVKDAEDALLTIMNDPELNLSIRAEIIPTDMPSIEPLTLDAVGEVAAALTHRTELREARLAIEQAQLAIGVAKNQALPKLDALFRYIVDGLGSNADRAFSQLSMNDFHEYVIGLEFEWPIGARAGEAAIRRARLQQAQAIAGHKMQIEKTILDVRRAVREILTSYDQIMPSLRAAQASEAQLEATKARMEKRDPANLEVELSAHERLANARLTLLRVLADYNIALVNLERQKGTLMQYNNIAIHDVDQDREEHAAD